MEICRNCKDYYLKSIETHCFNCGMIRAAKTRIVWKPDWNQAVMAGLVGLALMLFTLALFSITINVIIKPSNPVSESQFLALEMFRVLRSVSFALPYLGLAIYLLRFKREETPEELSSPNLMETEKNLRTQQFYNNNWLQETEATAQEQLLNKAAKTSLTTAKDRVVRQNRLIEKQLAEIEFARVQNRVEMRVSDLGNDLSIAQLKILGQDLKELESGFSSQRPADEEVVEKYARLKESMGAIRADLINRHALHLTRAVKADTFSDKTVGERLENNGVQFELNTVLLDQVKAQEFDRERFRLESLEILEEQNDGEDSKNGKD